MPLRKRQKIQEVLPGLGGAGPAASAAVHANDTHRHHQLLDPFNTAEAEVQSGIDQPQLRGGEMVLAEALGNLRISEGVRRVENDRIVSVRSFS